MLVLIETYFCTARDSLMFWLRARCDSDHGDRPSESEVGFISIFSTSGAELSSITEALVAMTTVTSPAIENRTGEVTTQKYVSSSSVKFFQSALVS